MITILVIVPLLLAGVQGFGWGFYGHKKVNYYAVFLLPPEMLVFYKANLLFVTEHAVDPDKRRYAVREEGPRHYIDLDQYGRYPYDSLPREWTAAVEKYSEDSLNKHGIVPWWIQVMLGRLTAAFREKNGRKILKLSADLGHYVADAHVPLHASSNHNGQLTGQHGIHGFWESRIPELLAEKEWSFFAERASYLRQPLAFSWKRVLQSAGAADTVLRFEKKLNDGFPPDAKYAFENRNGLITRQYSSAYTLAYDRLLGGMVERRFVESVQAVASMWYTAWVNAGQPDLRELTAAAATEIEKKEYEELNGKWREGEAQGKACN